LLARVPQGCVRPTLSASAQALEAAGLREEARLPLWTKSSSDFHSGTVRLPLAPSEPFAQSGWFLGAIGTCPESGLGIVSGMGVPRPGHIDESGK